MFNKVLAVRHRSFGRGFNVPTPGYIDPEYRQYNYFVKDILLFGVIRVYTKTLFREHVPNWAWIQQGATGYTEWKSAAPRELWDLCKKV